MAKVKAAFPALDPLYYQILVERLKNKGFSDQRLIDAVNNVIDNCQYPTPTMANFLSFDKRIKILTYSQATSMIPPGKNMDEVFTKIKIKGQLAWIRTEEKNIYNIPDEL